MKKLPSLVETIKTLEASEIAKEVLDNILERKQELEDYVAVVQPLLYTISVALYGEDNAEDVALSKLVFDAINLINRTTDEPCH